MNYELKIGGYHDMKAKSRKFIATLLALMMVLGIFTGIPLFPGQTARADEPELI